VIRIRAERRCGELLKEMGEKGERNRRGGNHGNQHQKLAKSHDVILPPTLSDLGISPNESSKYQQLAAIPEKKFEEIP
jgi:hypothetical protein